MIFLYSLGIRCYFLIIRLLSLFNKKARLFISGRISVFKELKIFSERFEAPIVWFHAASLGEFEQGLPLMEAYKQAYPTHGIFVTFFSPSGYELRKNHPIADHTAYLPLDSRKNALHLLDLVKPVSVFFIKYEYWFHYLKTVNEQNIPLYSLSALFTSNHIFFKWYGSTHRKMLSFFNHTFVQNQSSLDLVKDIGIGNVSISGDTRFDRVLQTIANPNEYPEIATFKGGSTLCIIGSAWPSDMQVLRSFINDSPKDTKFLIAPHVIENSQLERISQGIIGTTHRYSDNRDIPQDTKVLLLDTMGMLSSIYQYGDFAYIGGAFSDGLHNILEAVAFGLPVAYGNKGLEKFPESIALAHLKGGFIVQNAQEASSVLHQLLDVDFRLAASKVCRTYVLENAGATQHIMNYLKQGF